MQCFPDSVKGWGEGEGSEVLLGVGEFFYQVVGTLGGVILTIQTFFSKLKTAFCES